MDPVTRATQFIHAIPHCAALGITVVDVSAGAATLALPYAPHLVGDPSSGVIAGGAVSVLMDTACATAAVSHPGCGGVTATIDLRIDYMRAATPGQTITARAECHHVTQHVAFVRAVATDDGDGPVATATGTFTVARGVA